MNTERNRSLVAIGIGLILGNILGAVFSLMGRGYFNLLGVILFTVVTLGVGLILLAAFFEEENAVV